MIAQRITYGQRITKPLTDTIAQEPPRLTSARCPTCGIDRPTFHDKSGSAFFTRHQQAGRGSWCEMSGKAVNEEIQG